jgi:hypothetical protein
MDSLVKALGPAFAAGFAIQRFLELIDIFLDTSQFFKDNKKIILGVLSLGGGLLLAFGLGLRVLQPLGIANAPFWDPIVTAFIVSAGTEGFNSIMKFLGYIKEDKKAVAADKIATANAQGIAALTRAV